MQESLHKHKPKSLSEDESCEALEAATHCLDDNSSGKEVRGIAENSAKSLFKNWALMSSVIVYSIFSLHDMAYTEVHITWHSPAPLKFLFKSFSNYLEIFLFSESISHCIDSPKTCIPLISTRSYPGCEFHILFGTRGHVEMLNYHTMLQ